MGFDFSGYATKHNLKCSDGRTILQDAFKGNDGQTVPLVWQHMHNDPSNILGHAKLENRKDGVYAYATLNDTEAGRTVKSLIEHGDIKALSIFANKLIHKGQNVVHGEIKEVSLVLSGANPEAYIDNITIMHSDGSVNTSDDEAVIYTGLDFDILNSSMLTHEDGKTKEADMADEKKDEEETLADIFGTLTEKQKTVVYAIVGAAITKEDEVEHSDDYEEYEEDEDDEEEDEDGEEEDEDDEEEEHMLKAMEEYIKKEMDRLDSNDKHLQHNYEGDNFMKNNVFDNTLTDYETEKTTLSHAQFDAIVDDAVKFGSFRESFFAHTQSYGIEDIENLFPDAKMVDAMPSTYSREMDWVKEVMGQVKSSPFSRIKSSVMDITADDARARGYVKGALKKEEVVKALKRVTLPTTVYKKQKLDRDDIIDIVDLDVISWLKKEMRVMLDEEIARCILIGDGRDAASADKVNDENIRPIYTDNNLYAHKVLVSNVDTATAIDDIIRARKYYKGAGNPVLYTSNDFLTDMLLLKDGQERYVYNNEKDLATKLRVSSIVEVPIMEGVTRAGDGTEVYELLGIIVNLRDYVVGADKGGKVSMFDDFDIDYNQQKYLIETRCSGALTQPKSALVLEKLETVQGAQG